LIYCVLEESGLIYGMNCDGSFVQSRCFTSADHALLLEKENYEEITIEKARLTVDNNDSTDSSTAAEVAGKEAEGNEDEDDDEELYVESSPTELSHALPLEYRTRQLISQLSFETLNCDEAKKKVFELLQQDNKFMSSSQPIERVGFYRIINSNVEELV
jgi:hypothetical protein